VPDNSGEHAGEPIPDAFFALQDLVTEAMQLLQTAGLIMPRSYKVNQDHAYSQWLNGLVTTRRGRAALANGTVGRIVASSTRRRRDPDRTRSGRAEPDRTSRAVQRVQE
jgi:hypothetical protein